MQIVALSDIHGRSLSELEEQVLSSLNPDDLLLILGDMDTTESIREVRELQERSESPERYDTYVGPGNHEHGLYHGIYFHSSSMGRREHFFKTLRQELLANHDVLQYVGQLLQNPRVQMDLDVSKHGQNYPTIALHGALDGSLMSHKYAEGQETELWYRLLNDGNEHRKNFAEMRNQGFRVMIRGHDPDPQYVYKDSTGEIVFAQGDEHELLPQRLHTITVGDWYDGNFITIDTAVQDKENPILKFHTIQ